MLLIFGGLPASGKSTISRQVARRLGAVYLRVDTIEHTLMDINVTTENGEGYELAYRLAADNLSLGSIVVADSVNSIDITRNAWRAVGETASVPVLELEIMCSDQREHKRRVENRKTNTTQKFQLTWDDVLTRHYEPWPQVQIVIDTAGQSPEQSIERILSQIDMKRQ